MKIKNIMMKMLFPIETKEVIGILEDRKALSQIYNKTDKEIRYLKDIQICVANRNDIASRMLVPATAWSYLIENMSSSSRRANSHLIKKTSSSMDTYKELWEDKTWMLDLHEM